jgi:NADH-quinone oxidoreductase subunit N
MVFVLAGMAFKVSAAPFHMWTPDVYEGAPTPITAFLATAPKVAAMALIARVVQDAFGGVIRDWSQVLAALSVASMFLGAIAAIGQRDIKRLMAYSSIAHMGFALMGLAAGTAMGVQAMLVYMSIYVIMNIGTFAFILSLERDGKSVTDIASLNQFAKVEPLKALAVLVLMFSLAGVPPLLGFWGKFGVLLAAYDAGMAWLALAGAVASVIGAFYYLRIIYFMYFGADVAPATSRMSSVQWAVFIAASIAVVAGTINLFGLEGPATAAAEALLG